MYCSIDRIPIFLTFFVYIFFLNVNSQQEVRVIGNSEIKMFSSGHGDFIIYSDSVCFQKHKPPFSAVRWGKTYKIDCDKDSFKVLGNGYAMDRVNVFYGEIILKDLDHKSFTDLEYKSSVSQSEDGRFYFKQYLAKDKNKVYFGENVFSYADPKTIECLSNIYAKDINHVFIGDKIIEKADAKSFELIEGRFAKDNNYIYHIGKIISDNPGSFEIISYDFRYAKDNENVYYWWGCGQPREIDTITEVNIENFRLLSDFRATDGEKVFWHAQLMPPNIDIESFISIDNQYSLDKNCVFFKNKLISGANPKSFEVIGKYYSKDDLAVFHFESLVEFADPETFIVLEYQWGKDKSYIFFRDTKRDDIDYKSFSCENLTVKDKNYFYGNDGMKSKKNK